MARSTDLEAFRAVFADRTQHTALGIITKLGVAPDRSVLRVQCSLPEEVSDAGVVREVIAMMTWETVGPDTGDFEFPEVGDLVLLQFVGGSKDAIFVTRRLTSKTDLIPQKALAGHRVVKAKKKLYLGSETAIHLTKGEDGTEPLVLGLVLMDMLEQYVDKVKEAITAIKTGPIGIGNLGAPVPTDPALVSQLTLINTDLDTIKSTFLTTAATNIVSQLAFTERGE